VALGEVGEAVRRQMKRVAAGLGRRGVLPSSGSDWQYASIDFYRGEADHSLWVPFGKP
jgi:hypothetical protein